LYVEFATDATYANGQPYIGLANAGFAITNYLGAVNYSAGIAYQSTSVSAGFTANYSTGQYQVANDVWAMAVDFATGSVWIAKNNVWINSSNPATGTAPVVSFVPATVGALFPGMSFNDGNNGVWTLQSTAASQKYAPPSGFSAWDVPMSTIIIDTAPVPPSVAGIPQPVFDSGSATLPAAGPITGSPIIPPPTIGDPVGFPVFPPVGPNTAPVPVPVGPLVGPAVGPAPVPPSVAGVQQPQFKSGSATVPASLFPGEFTTTPPSPPIVFANVFKIGTVPPPLPSTPGQNPPPIVASSVPTIPQLPWPPVPVHPLPVNTVRPTVTGTPEVGSNLTSTTGTWTNATTYAREWLRDGSPIAGATGVTYALVGADAGTLITVDITATGPGGEASADSLPVGPITEAASEGVTREATREERQEVREEERQDERQARRHPTRANPKRKR
jgi:hypothetical protein